MSSQRKEKAPPWNGSFLSSLPTALLLAAMSALEHLSQPTRRRTLDGISALLLYLNLRRRVIKRNLDLCFPSKGAQRLNQMSRLFYRHFVHASWMLWWALRASKEQIKDKVEFEGIEYLKAAQEKGPVIIFCPHFVLAPLLGPCLSYLSKKVGYVYDPPSNRLLHYLMHEVCMQNRVPHAWWQRCLLGRRRAQYKAVPVLHRGAARHCLRLLKANYSLIVLPDQARKARKMYFDQFFGNPVSVSIFLPWLAYKSKAAVVPAIVTFKASGDHNFKVRFLEPMNLKANPDDHYRDALRLINQSIERWVRNSPSEYLWSHQRFKFLKKDVYAKHP